MQLDDFQQGQLLLVDKPLGWTSFDVVSKLRWLIKRKFGIKNIKVGHAGTLDPLATGLLLICTGAFTKRIAELTLADKAYTGTFTLGATRPSHDMETEISASYPLDGASKEAIYASVKALSGIYMQRPPQFSAKLVDGKRAYLSARKGKEVDIPMREVNISTFDVGLERIPEVDFFIVCSKGTYIRAIARDLGEALGTGAYLSALRRTAVGEYSIDAALSVESLQRALEPSAR